MTKDQAGIAVALLNSYAHQYLGLPVEAVLVASAEKNGQWALIVGGPDEAKEAADFDEGKRLIDDVWREWEWPR